MNNRLEKYKGFCTEEYLMGPNSLQLLNEMMNKVSIKENSRILDLGAGKGITSLFLANETNSLVYAAELWINPTVNYESFKEWGVADKVIPIKVDANELPFAEGYFDVMVCIDAFHYFAGKKNFFEEKILPFLKKDGLAIIAMPGLKKELSDNYPDLMVKWFEEDYDELNKFHCRKWWLDLLDNYEEYEIVEEFDLDCFYEAWEDWFNCGHEFGKKDKEFFMKGLGEYLSFIGLVIKKK